MFLENGWHFQKTSELYKNIWILRQMADMKKANFPLHSLWGSGRIPLVAAREVKNLSWGGRAQLKDRTADSKTCGLRTENFQKKCLTKITHFVILYRLSSRARAWKGTGRCQAAPRKAPLKPNIWQLNRNATLKISFRLFIRSDFKHRIWKELQRKVWTNQTKQITERWTKQIS